ncbi:MAG: FAD-binding oxidoreductase [Planctomycetes bacterium]|nr:FAD-binding oxidoreductase [Planctomycetota bacterium]
MPDFERIEPVRHPYSDCVRAVMPKMDMRRYVPWLESRYVQELGGAIEPMCVNSCDEVFAMGYESVVNCTGIGAGKLANDRSVTPYRGQILRVRNLIGLKECLLEESREEIGSYVFGFDDYLVLGGTFERGQTNLIPEPTAIEAIVSRCQALLVAGGVTQVEKLADERIAALAGLRPCRDIGPLHEAVRLEQEHRSDGKTLVHNYGHGRAGVTLSWGCANQVVELLEAAGIRSL